MPQSATHAIIESYSNFGEHSETSVRQLYNQLISVVVVLDNLALSTCYLHSESSVRQLYNQLISVVVVLDNLALSTCYLNSETSVGQLYNQLISVEVVLDNLALTSKKNWIHRNLFLPNYRFCQAKNQVFGEKLCVKYGSLANFGCFVPQPLIHNVGVH